MSVYGQGTINTSHSESSLGSRAKRGILNGRTLVTRMVSECLNLFRYLKFESKGGIWRECLMGRRGTTVLPPPLLLMLPLSDRFLLSKNQKPKIVLPSFQFWVISFFGLPNAPHDVYVKCILL